MTVPDLTRELEVASRLAREAGALLLHHRAVGFDVQHKTSLEDPVTVADREASALIVAGLAGAFPNDGLLSEEETDSAARLSQERVWIIDPIDGTSEFIKGTADYCVSIGLAMGDAAVLGVVYAPTTDELFAGVVGQGVWKNGQKVNRGPRSEGWRVAVSDTEFGRELNRHDLPGMVPSGSIALKLARLSADEADATFTMSPRSEWDIAAGDALVQAAGGTLRRRDGQPVLYNQPSPHLEQGLIAGLPDALEWLEGELSRRRLPTAHLGMKASAPAWSYLETADQAALGGHSGVSIRHAGPEVLALLVIDPDTRTVERAEGDAFHLERLTRDVVRAAGPLSTPGAKLNP
ncbi:3'(2'),5'-bisphosphate nucleotidase CysQ [Deinococcus radiopugnans]|uniref:3'(2'),5'-bisphosphate nucleotidase CysQ n=1 Tax=Deinococcus radiopugnans ATCC 19172 TaxID=585398 RepID=A0A5C4Y697_9DEIO|nr:3'(2'),5'-bisphosphate nucleotidase CysQ [Deinococcus radiopugnans]MBB6017242.1 myo-inositol-1(or 4)-monophosphatase [Deinococcus radiopugnans ATCC 19172]TNM70555.1 3'(2'),5'-bisphosphate nucleotidase CysQ [Deinococcus radiopugnans ATCC 19172]